MADLSYRKRDKDIVVRRKNGNVVDTFKNAQGAYHDKPDLVVITSTGKRVRIDKFGFRHW